VPTINEVWEQALAINANLGTLHNDAVDLKSCCAEVNQRLDALTDRVGDGFTLLAQGIAVSIAHQQLTNQLLLHQTKQLSTVICALEHISEQTCELLDEADQQTDAQRAIAAAGEALAHMAATANPDAALALDREREQRAALERCCPPEPRKPRCTYRPCDDPGAPQRLVKPPAFRPGGVAQPEPRRR
jgi:hypothetical protein